MLLTMKTVLQVLQYGDFDFRFKTDFDPHSNPDVILKIISGAAFSMSTTLWGGNEGAVLAVLRSLIIADLAVSVNRKEMIKMMDEQSAAMAKAMREAKKEFEKEGGKVITFAPGIKPPKMAN